MIHPGVRRRPLLLLPLPPSASADIAFDRKRAEINLLERGGGVRACVVRLCKLTERGLNTQVAREEEREGDDFRHIPWMAVSRSVRIGSARRGGESTAWPRASTGHDMLSGNVSILNMYASIRRRLLRTRFNV